MQQNTPTQQTIYSVHQFYILSQLLTKHKTLYAPSTSSRICKFSTCSVTLLYFSTQLYFSTHITELYKKENLTILVLYCIACLTHLYKILQNFEFKFRRFSYSQQRSKNIYCFWYGVIIT